MEPPVKEEMGEEPESPPPNANVDIHVTPTNGTSPAQVFSVHKWIICRHSPFLDAAFKTAPGDEPITRTFLDGDPNTFKRIVEWLYTEEIQKVGEHLPQFCELLDLWLMADLLVMPKLQDDAMKLLLDRSLLPPPTLVIDCEHIYNNTIEGSPLRRLLVAYTVGGDNFRLPKDYTPIPREMLIEMLEKIGTHATDGTKIAREARADFFIGGSSPTTPKGGSGWDEDSSSPSSSDDESYTMSPGS